MFSNEQDHCEIKVKFSFTDNLQKQVFRAALHMAGCMCAVHTEVK